MNISNVFRFGTDTFDYSGKSALLVSNEALDCSNFSDVDGFTVTGSQPENTDRRVIFKIDGSLWKFNGQNLVAYNGEGEFEDIIKYGNTVAQLNALTSIPGFVGKLVYPIIALKAGWTVTAMPTIKIALRVRNNTTTYNYNYRTAIRHMIIDDPTVVPRITAIAPGISSTGNASCDVYIRLCDGDGVWGNWIPIEEAVGSNATAVQFEMHYAVSTIDGSDSVICDYINFYYNTGGLAVNGNSADIYSDVDNYGNDLQTCYVVVKHDKLVDSKITAYVNFMDAPKHRELISIGTSNTTGTPLKLGVGGVKDSGIDPGSIKLFADGEPVQDFDYNVEVSEVTLNIGAGKAITASYDYDRDSETWLKMKADGDQQPYLDDGTFMSRFTYTLKDADAVNKKISNVRLQLTRPTGSVKNFSLGSATGKTQLYVLPHAADETTISLPDATWSYDEDSQILTYTATKGTELRLTYSWRGEQIIVRSFAAGWVVAT